MDVNSKSKTSPKYNKVDTYISQMKEISFMTKDLKDVPEIFDVHSEKCKLFLVKTFTVLNTEFHYLSFLGNETIDEELAKAAFILRIYPCNSDKKSHKIFHNMSGMEVHKFWMKFFKLCKINSQYIDSNSLNKTIDNIANFHSIFSEQKKTMQYFNYDMSVVNPKILKVIDVNKEIESWIPSSFCTSISDSSLSNANQDMTFEEKHQINVDIGKLISDIDYIKRKTDFENLNISSSYPYKDFFSSFNQAVKIIKNYRDNINSISSFTAQDLIADTKSHKDSYWLSNNCQIKGCNNIIQKLISLKEKVH